MTDKSIYSIGSDKSGQFTTFDSKTGNKTVFVEPGESKVIIDSNETGIITRLWCTLPGWFYRYWDENAKVDPTVLRLTILKIYFDGATDPSIVSPIGDFFGIGHCEYHHFTSKYIGMSSGGFSCYLPMPFYKGFKLEVENMHPSYKAELFFNINYQVMDKLPDNSGRLCCAFRCGEINGWEPLEIMNVNGRGHFAGCALSIQSNYPNYLAYLEAPEYIWIDDDTENNPSIMGTGMEDYFNGGWYFRNGEFASDYYGAPLKDHFRSMISMYRFHENDRINFSKRMRMAFVNPWKKERLKPFIFSSTAYYYVDQAAKACYGMPDIQQLLNLYKIRDRDFQSYP